MTTSYVLTRNDDGSYGVMEVGLREHGFWTTRDAAQAEADKLNAQLECSHTSLIIPLGFGPEPYRCDRCGTSISRCPWCGAHYISGTEHECDEQ